MGRAAALLQREQSVEWHALTIHESEDYYCCLAAKEESDECGTCWPHEKVTSSHWCGQSEANCGACSGSWCSRMGSTVESATPETHIQPAGESDSCYGQMA